MLVGDISVMLVTSEYRGDHSADVRIAERLGKDETVEQIAKRLLKNKADFLEVRFVVVEGDPSHG